MVHTSKNAKGDGFQNSSAGKPPQNGSRIGGFQLKLNINHNLGFGPQISPGFVSPIATDKSLHLHRRKIKVCSGLLLVNPTWL